MKRFMPFKGIRIRESGKNLTRGIRNPGLWSLEYSSRKDWKLLIEIRIHGVESRFRDYHGFPFMEYTLVMQCFRVVYRELVKSN